MWLQVELPTPTVLTEVQFDSNAVAVDEQPAVPGAPTRTGGGRPAGAPPPPAYPRGYRVQVSVDGNAWGKPVAEGKGNGRHTVVPFSPVKAKFVRMIQTEKVSDPAPWSVERLQLYEAGAASSP